MPHSKLTADAKASIIEAYAAGERLAKIASLHGVTRQAVRWMLRRSGVPVRDTSVSRTCSQCGESLKVRRSRSQKYERSYCSVACYVARVQDLGSGWQEDRHSTRKAREVVRKFTTLAEGNVVHHIDQNQSNNDPGNLMVFVSHAEHMRWHRAGFEASGVVPLWRGDRSEGITSARRG